MFITTVCLETRIQNMHLSENYYSSCYSQLDYMAVWNWFSQVFKYIYSRFANFEVDDACSVCTSNSHTNNLSSQ